MSMHKDDVLCHVKLILMIYYGIVILLYYRLKQLKIQEIKSLNFMTDFLRILYISMELRTLRWNAILYSSGSRIMSKFTTKDVFSEMQTVNRLIFK